jgi:hypothetical protein
VLGVVAAAARRRQLGRHRGRTVHAAGELGDPEYAVVEGVPRAVGLHGGSLRAGRHEEPNASLRAFVLGEIPRRDLPTTATEGQGKTGGALLHERYLVEDEKAIRLRVRVALGEEATVHLEAQPRAGSSIHDEVEAAVIARPRLAVAGLARHPHADTG